MGSVFLSGSRLCVAWRILGVRQGLGWSAYPGGAENAEARGRIQRPEDAEDARRQGSGGSSQRGGTEDAGDERREDIGSGFLYGSASLRRIGILGVRQASQSRVQPSPRFASRSLRLRVEIATRYPAENYPPWREVDTIELSP
jgi:hypothetical protein